MVVQADGRIVVAGGSGEDNLSMAAAGLFLQSDFAIARLMPNGAVDPTFGNAGRVTLNLGSTISSISGLALQPDGKIIAVGFSGNSSDATTPVTTLAVARFNANGSLDSSFGNGGYDLIGDGLSEGFGVAVQADGKIVVAAQGGLVRLTSSGMLDTSFGQQGVAAPMIGQNGPLVDDAVVALDSTGRIIVGGDLNITAAVSRFTASGTPDPSFGKGGVETVKQLGPVTSLAIEPDGRIVAVGSIALLTDGESALAAFRLSTNGVLDRSFGSAGIFTTTFGDPTVSPPALTRNGTGTAVALQSDGRIVWRGT